MPNPTLEALSALISGQDNACAICECSDWGPHGPIVDHDHSTGAIRGILCTSCNLAIGIFKDNVRIIRMAADYLEKT